MLIVRFKNLTFHIIKHTYRVNNYKFIKYKLNIYSNTLYKIDIIELILFLMKTQYHFVHCKSNVKTKIMK